MLCTECYNEIRVTEDTEGMLYYPGFDQYGNNVHCDWTFLAPDGYVHIALCFTSVTFADDFSGPVRVIGRVYCVCVYVHRHHLGRIPRSKLQVKVPEMLRSQTSLEPKFSPWNRSCDFV